MQAAANQIQGKPKTRVLIVDDSITICRFLEATFSEDPELDVVGYALDPFEARERIKLLEPDVITLDVEMPKMDGVTFLKNLMRLHPMPVVMFSSLTDVGAAATIDSLQAGAVDFMPKHSSRSGEDIGEYIQELIRKVKSAAGAQITKSVVEDVATPLPDLADCKKKLRAGQRASNDIKRVIAIGASTGGPEALRHVVGPLSTLDCSLVIAQHMPANFMASFAMRMNSQSSFNIKLAVDGEPLKPGYGYIAPGDQHLIIDRNSDGLFWKLLSTPKISGHRPSVDALFNSLATQLPQSALGVLMTGMGDDGAKGLKAMRDAGSVTFAQDKNTSVVWGMPGKAHSINAQDEMLGLVQIAPAINKIVKGVN